MAMLRKRPRWKQQQQQKQQERLQANHLAEGAPVTESGADSNELLVGFTSTCGHDDSSGAKASRVIGWMSMPMPMPMLIKTARPETGRRRGWKSTSTTSNHAETPTGIRIRIGIIVLLFLLTGVALLWIVMVIFYHGADVKSNGRRYNPTNGSIHTNTYPNGNGTIQTWAECGCQVTKKSNAAKMNVERQHDHDHEHRGRIAYLVTLHNQRTLQDSLPLMKAISTPDNIILIHMDTKMNMEDYTSSELHEFIEGSATSGCQACGATVLVERKFDVQWGTWSMNHPTHWAMKELISNPKFVNQWDVFINVSADTLPVYTPDVMSRLFHPRNKEGLYNVNFVTSHSCATGLHPTHIRTFPSTWHKRTHYERDGAEYVISYMEEEVTAGRDDTDAGTAKTEEEDDDKITTMAKMTRKRRGRRKKETIDIYFGSQWMMLSPSFVEYVATSLSKNDSLATRLKAEFIKRGVLMTDETFIPTLLMHHSTFRHTLPHLVHDNGDDGGGDNDRTTTRTATAPTSTVIHTNIKSVRYERMDENMPDAFGNVIHDQRYDVPDSLLRETTPATVVVDVPRPWGPYYLGVYDLANIKNSGALFIRKVTRDVDPNMLRLFPVQDGEDIPSIQWPSEVKVSDKVDWKRLGELYVARKKKKKETKKAGS